MHRLPFKISRMLAVAVASGVVLGYAGEAAAIDRKSFDGGFASDARPGYGAERRGSGAERQYYGAERFRSFPGRDRDGDLSDGSIIEFEDDPDFAEEGDDGFASPFGVDDARSGIYPGFGGTASGSFVYFDDENGDRPATSMTRTEWLAATGSRIVDVEAQRLGKRSFADTVKISYVGDAKIIRIPASENGTEETDGPAKSSERATFEPWSDEWKRYCARTHHKFDATRGTYLDGDGSRRFCTGG